jgi:hypothetical protein
MTDQMTGFAVPEIALACKKSIIPTTEGESFADRIGDRAGIS